MPRNGSGVYSLPPGTPGVPDTPVESPPYNNFIADIENDANLPRPIMAGGTGASTPAQALENLGAFPKVGGTLTGSLVVHAANPALTLRPTGANQSRFIVGADYAAGAARWVLALGDSTVEAGSNAGSDFAVSRYNDAGALQETPLSIKRSDGIVTLAHTLNFASAPSIRFGSNNVIHRSTNYLVLTDGFAGASNGAILIGNLTDQSNYYDNTAHVWRNRVAGNMMALDSTKLQLFNGVIANAIGNILESSTYTILREATDAAGAKITLGPAGDPANYHRNTNHHWHSRGGSVHYASLGASGLSITGGVALSGGTAIFKTAASVQRWVQSPLEGGGGADNMIFYACNDSGTITAATLTLRRSDSYLLLASGIIAGTGNVYKPGGGPWIDSSDARIKNVIGNYASGLDQITSLQPVRFTYKGNDTSDPGPDAVSPHQTVAKNGTEFVGLIAQHAEAVMPEIVNTRSGYIDGKAVNDLRSVDAGPLIYALVNACKELAARIEALESV